MTYLIATEIDYKCQARKGFFPVKSLLCTQTHKHQSNDAFTVLSTLQNSTKGCYLVKFMENLGEKCQKVSLKP